MGLTSVEDETFSEELSEVLICAVPVYLCVRLRGGWRGGREVT